MGQCEPHGGGPDAALPVRGQVNVHGGHHPKETLEKNWRIKNAFKCYDKGHLNKSKAKNDVSSAQSPHLKHKVSERTFET